MRNHTYGGVRGRKTKVGRKLFRFPPTRFFFYFCPENRQTVNIIIGGPSCQTCLTAVRVRKKMEL